MRNLIIIFLSFIIVFSFNTIAYSQKKCDDYVIRNCDSYGPPFKYSGQSKSAIFELGQKSLFSITVYKGFEYRISLCAEKNMKDVLFRIREDNTNKTILYDSSVDEEDFLEKLFYVKSTKNLLVEVYVPEGDIPIEEQTYKKRFGCVGVLIEYDKRKGTGF